MKNHPSGLAEIINHAEFCRTPFTFINLVFPPGFAFDDVAYAADFDLNAAQLTYEQCNLPVVRSAAKGVYSPCRNCFFGVLSPW